MSITAKYVDTCLSDYLTDSYSRPGQTLCLASLGDSKAGTRDQLYDSIDWDSGLPESIEDSEIKAALMSALDGVDLSYIDENGNPCNETPEDRDGDEPYVYVVLEFTPANVVKMRLTLDVEYQANGVDPYEFKLMLESIARSAAANGQMSGDTSAEVKTWGATAEEVTG
jgi:hypothetical protein